jgi:hypothetical protein
MPLCKILSFFLHHHPACAYELRDQPTAIPELVFLLSAANQEVAEWATIALANIINHYPASIPQLLGDSNVIRCLVKSLESLYNGVVGDVALALSTILRNEALSAIVLAVNEGAIPRLFKLVAFNNLTVAGHATVALAILLRSVSDESFIFDAPLTVICERLTVLQHSANSTAAAAAKMVLNLISNYQKRLWNLSNTPLATRHMR